MHERILDKCQGRPVTAFECDQRSCVKDEISRPALSRSLRAHSLASSLIGPCSASDSSSASLNAWRLLATLRASSTAAERLGALPASTAARASTRTSGSTEMVTRSFIRSIIRATVGR